MMSKIDIIKKYLEAGGSICPFSKKCLTHYVMDVANFKPILRMFENPRNQAMIIVASTSYRMGWFDNTKKWAQDMVLKTMKNASQLTYPEVSEEEISKEIAAIEPVLRDDADIRRPNIAFRDKAVIAICMSPVYPLTHPRYVPLPIVVLTWDEDLKEAGVFPKVREAMTKEHGFVYDALELMLPLPVLV